MKIYPAGILAAFSWNSNQWREKATEEDINHSNFDYVKENRCMHEDLNFGHERFPTESDGTFIAYTPMFNRLPSIETSKNVSVVFFRSKNYHSNKNLIVGLYAFPVIEGKIMRKAKHQYYKHYNFGNLKSKPENILLFEKPIEINNEIVSVENYLPIGKKLGQQGFNYLSHENVYSLLDCAIRLNRNDKKLISLNKGLRSDMKKIFG